ncbi:FAD-binding domain-containing protein [Nadsonia fulvescens var. elongata DSM 6958]|uniref:D-lactate dehydrogenase (cytochrome) n=1 Tax=Nadsonia fulvescens var. elongata DSM 6958 TaxID=857566 RepID=A0A1E3PM09_9ASCO|nr:FAD-binding domain-containing protein [Nadsonia fulvescens var. elongata DSM 6958]
MININRSVSRLGRDVGLSSIRLNRRKAAQLSGKRFKSSSSGNQSAQNSVVSGTPFKYLLGAGAIFACGIYGGSLYSATKTASPQDHVAASFVDKSTSPIEDLTAPKYADAATLKIAFAEIIKIVGEDSSTTTDSELDTHSDSFFNTHHAKEGERPGLVVMPNSTEQVSQIVKVAHKYRVPITPYSGGTSLEGHYTPTQGGISMDFRNMSEIVALHKDDLDVVVQPGIGWQDLNEILKDDGLFFPPDPGPGAQIGGMIGTSCSGTNAARYGTIRENVVSLTVVLADGTIVKTKKRPRKSSAGYNLTQLFIGSEGTLGIVTEATLKLSILPKNETVAVVPFKTIDAAAQVAQEVIQSGVVVGAIELLDDEMMKCINAAGQTSRTWSENPTIFFKFAGTPNGVRDTIEQVKHISAKHESISFDFAANEEELEELWSARKYALWSTFDVAPPGFHAWTTDAAVPISQLSKIVSETKKDIVDNGLFGTIVGHVGDGNFHAIIMFDPKTQHGITQDIVHRMIERALKADGTCTGEHGVGLGKRTFLMDEVGQTGIDTIRHLKVSFDPLGILNPGKVVNINPADDITVEQN